MSQIKDKGRLYKYIEEGTAKFPEGKHICLPQDKETTIAYLDEVKKDFIENFPDELKLAYMENDPVITVGDWFKKWFGESECHK